MLMVSSYLLYCQSHNSNISMIVCSLLPLWPGFVVEIQSCLDLFFAPSQAGVQNVAISVPVCLLVCLNKSSAVAEMGDHLATVDMARKVGASVPLSGGELGPHLTQCRLGQGLPPYQVAS